MVEQLPLRGVQVPEQVPLQQSVPAVQVWLSAVHWVAAHWNPTQLTLQQSVLEPQLASVGEQVGLAAQVPSDPQIPEQQPASATVAQP
jgi:hypothetical protein